MPQSGSEETVDSSRVIKSPNWDQFGHTTEFVRDGFPFHEGWPQRYPLDAWFLLRLRDGRRVRAQVDYSTQYRDEGVRWRVEGSGHRLDQAIVVCWHSFAHLGPATYAGSDGHTMLHYSVGAVIQREDRYLLIERRHGTPGFAGVAGHQEFGESPENAIIREVREETGLIVVDAQLLWAEEVGDDVCRHGVSTHYWQVFSCQVVGTPVPNVDEMNSLGWFNLGEIAHLQLEPVWRRWFVRLGVIVE